MTGGLANASGHPPVPAGRGVPRGIHAFLVRLGTDGGAVVAVPYGKTLLDIQLFWPRDPGKSRIRWP